jgi:hypothetical protein
MSATKIGIRDVINFFKNADLDAVELALDLGSESAKSRRAARAAMSARLSKARAAKGKGKPKAAATDNVDVRPPQLRARHAGEPAEHQPESVVATA